MGEFVSAKVRISEAPRRARARAQTSSPGSFRTRLGASWRRWKITTSATVNCWGNQRSCSNFCVVTGVATELGAEGAVSTLLAALAVMAAARWRRLGLTPLSDSIQVRRGVGGIHHRLVSRRRMTVTSAECGGAIQAWTTQPAPVQDKPSTYPL